MKEEGKEEDYSFEKDEFKREIEDDLKVSLKNSLHEELKSEIKKELRREILDELKRDYKAPKKEFVNEVREEKKSKVYKESREGVGVLVFIIVLIILIDIGGILYYYGPQINGFFSKIGNSVNESGNNNDDNVNSNNGKCFDGTKIGECSKEKPYYCYEGDLVKKAATCGCPSGQKLDFQDCVLD